MKFSLGLRALAFAAVLFYSSAAFAQNESYYFRPVPEPKDYGTLLLGIGPTWALGDLAATDFERLESGAAEMGFGGTLSYLSPTLGNIGLIARGMFVITPVDKNVLQVNLESQYVNQVVLFTSIADVQSDSWNHFGGLGGLNLSLPSQRATFEVRGLVGWMQHTRPEFSFSYTPVENGAGSSQTYRRNESQGGALAWQAEAGFRYDFHKGAALGITLGYLASNPELSGPSSSPGSAGPTNEPLRAYTQPVNMIYLNFGIGVNLGNARR